MFEILFLSVLAIVWILFATIQDLKTNEIANWLNFSLVIFALGFRFFYSLFLDNFQFFYQGVIGLLLFFLLGNMLYYGKLFAGGDRKLFIALGAVLPFSYRFFLTLEILFSFLIIFLFVGAFYSLISSFYFGLKAYKRVKEKFFKQFSQNQKMIYSSLVFAIFSLIIGYLISELTIVFLAILIFLFPYLYIYAKAVDEACMIRKIKVSDLREGDWLYKDVKAGKKVIRATWDGLSKGEIALLRKKMEYVRIRMGIAFTPVFLLSFLVFLYLWTSGLWNSLW